MPVLVIAPELIVPVVLKLPLDCVKLPVCVNVPVIVVPASVVVPVTPSVPPIVALLSNVAGLVISTLPVPLAVRTIFALELVPKIVLPAVSYTHLTLPTKRIV